MSARNVKNTCPVCRDVEWYRISHNYEDEGRMVCQRCKAKAAEQEEMQRKSDARQDARDRLVSSFVAVLPAGTPDDDVEALVTSIHNFMEEMA